MTRTIKGQHQRPVKNAVDFARRWSQAFRKPQPKPNRKKNEHAK